MNQAQEIVSNLTNDQIPVLLEKINTKIFSNIEFASVENNIVDSDTGDTLLALDESVLRQKFNADMSNTVSRVVLNSLANDDDLAPLIVDAWEEVQNQDSLFIAEAITIGLIANLTLFMVSSKIEMDFGKVKITKEKVDNESVKAIMGTITSAIS